MLAFGSDWPIVGVDPVVGLSAAVLRGGHGHGDGQRGSGGENEEDAWVGAWVPEQRVSAEAALGAFTAGAAWAVKAEGKARLFFVSLWWCPVSPPFFLDAHACCQPSEPLLLSQATVLPDPSGVIPPCARMLLFFSRVVLVCFLIIVAAGWDPPPRRARGHGRAHSGPPTDRRGEAQNPRA